MSYEQIQQARAAIEDATGRERHQVGLVLGSGLSSYAATLSDSITVPYAEIPGFPQPAVEGHSGRLCSARVGKSNVLVLAGRVHCYEGWPLTDVVFGVRTAVACGCDTIILTNAAGSVREHLRPGRLVLIRDHINLTGFNPLMGANDERLGPRFPDMTDVYDPGLRALAREAGTREGIDLDEGVYAWFTGPSYETPAEVAMLARMGGDLAGMSTVPEAIAARHMGSRVLGISLVTNLAAGLSDEPLSHQEVEEAAARARPDFTCLMNALLEAISNN